MTSKGSKPRSSSCCLLDEPKPKAACQSVEEDTGIVSVRKGERQVSGPVLDVKKLLLTSHRIFLTKLIGR